MRLEAILEGLERREPAALARAISLVENQRDGFERVLSHVHARLRRGGTRRIGITGPPGAGKSTLTERLIQQFRSQELRVGVVAVDPTSPFTGGALLGDRIRMEAASLDPNVFIRSMATRGARGGLATTPNPTSGYLLIVPRTRTRPVDLTIEEGMKLVISAGALLPTDGPPQEGLDLSSLLARTGP